MKTLICWALLFSIQIFSQSYLNLHFNNGSYKNSLISSVRKITISANGEQMNFNLSNGTTDIENISGIRKLTLDDTPQGEPLPVELSSFTAILNGTSIIMTWRTETEVNNYGFEIERCMNLSNRDWVMIGFVKGNGNSNSPKEYSFTDTPQGEIKILYRLKQIDNDGQFHYSDILTVEIIAPSEYGLKQNFPNPFNPTTRIAYSLPSDGSVRIKIYDIIGNEIATLVNEEKKAGSYFVTFNGTNLTSGVYICMMTGKDFLKSIKMLLIK